MSQSTAPAARAKVVELLTAALTSTKVSWGGPSEAEDITDEMVYLGSVRRNVELRGMGVPASTQGTFSEDYRFPVMAVGRREGDDEQAAETRAWALVDAIETAIRADLSLAGVLHSLHAEFGDQEVSTEPLPDGWLYRASVELVCTSLI